MSGERRIEAGNAFLTFDIRSKSLLAGIGKVEGRLKRSASKIDAMGARISNAGRGMQGLGKGMIATATAAAAPLVASTVRFAGFSDKVLEAGARMQATKKQVEQLSVASRKLGRQTSFTAASMAELSGVLGQAGFSPRQVLAMQDGVQKLARATGVELAEAAGVVAGTLRQFNLQANEAGRVSDAMAAAVNGSYVNLLGLGESLSYVGKVAQSSGLSLEQTLSAVSALGDVSIQGSQAGTSLRRMLLSLTADVKRVEGVFGTSLSGRSFADQMDAISKSVRGMSTNIRAAKMEEAFGLIAVTGAIALTDSIDRMRELEKSFLSARGEAARTAKEIDSGLGGSFRRALSAGEGLALAIGKSLETPVVGAIEKISAGINRLTDQLEANPGLVKKFAVGLLAVGAAGAGLVGLGSAVVAIGSAFSVAALGVTAIASSIGAVVTAFGMIGAIPIAVALGAAVAAFDALALAALYSTGILDGLSGIARKSGAIVSSTFERVASDVRSVGREIATSIGGSIERIGDAFRQGDTLGAIKQFGSEVVHHFRILAVGIEIPLLQAAYVVGAAFSSMFSTIASAYGGLVSLIAKVDPTGLASDIAAAARVSQAAAGMIPRGVQAEINDAQKRLAQLLANPPAIQVSVGGSRWFADLRSGAMNLAETVVGAFQTGIDAIGGATASGLGQAAKTKGSGGSVGSTTAMFSRNNALFGLSTGSVDDQQLSTMEDMLAELAEINKNTAGNDHKTASDVGSHIAEGLRAAGSVMSDALSPLATGLSNALGIIGNAVTPSGKPEPKKPLPEPEFTGPVTGRPMYWDPNGPMPSGIAPPAPMTQRPQVGPPEPEPAIVRPTTGVPLNGVGTIEHHVRRMAIYLEAMKDAVAWFPREQPTFQPGKYDATPVWSNAIDQFGRDIMTGLNGALHAGGVINGYRAKGGPVKAGGSYVVGEKGPEMFVPTESGHILSNGLSSKIDGMFAGGTNDRKNKLIFGGIKAPKIDRPQGFAPKITDTRGILDAPQPLRQMGTSGKLETQLQKKREAAKAKRDRLERARAAKSAREAEMASKAGQHAKARQARLEKGQRLKDMRAQIHAPIGGQSMADRTRRSKEAMRQAQFGELTKASFQNPKYAPQIRGDVDRAAAKTHAAMQRDTGGQNEQEVQQELRKQTAILSTIAGNTEFAMA
ncbi:MAG: phage tail tape measure protein [Phycisphaera sp. RhM]|nr:phage tail tape measure protein [Phycisphaera sp. RhM]